MKIIFLFCLVGGFQLVKGQLPAPPAWMTEFPEFKTRTVKEWGQFDTVLTYRDIVKLKLPNTFFGISGNASNGRVAVFLTTKQSGRNGLIYGAYSDLNSTHNIESSWLAPVSNYSLLWGDYEQRLRSIQYRTRAHHSQEYFDADLQGVLFKAWSLKQIQVRVTVITFGESLLRDVKFAVPGIYGGIFSRGFLFERDFKTFYEDYTSITWYNTTKISENKPVMKMEANGELEIRGNMLQSPTDVCMPDIFLDVWGKMLTHNPGPSPEINTTYNYGLWVAGDIVSEDFIMQPKENWADYVFDTTHAIMDLKTLESYIKEHKHLPGIKSTADIKNGYQQHDINRKLLEKIEELTLYKIKQHEVAEKNKQELEAQSRRINEIREKLNKSL